MTVKRHVLDEAVREMLASVTHRPIALLEFSGETPPEMPYGILYPLFTDEGESSWADPTESLDLRYQVTCVGSDPKMTGWMSTEVRRAMVSYGDNGHRYLIFAPGVTVEARWGEGQGAIIPGGRDLYQTEDTYLVRAT